MNFVWKQPQQRGSRTLYITPGKSVVGMEIKDGQLLTTPRPSLVLAFDLSASELRVLLTLVCTC